MSKKTAFPDAWDDDWEAIADKPELSRTNANDQAATKVSKAQLRAKHAESNKQIWDQAETPETFHFIEARNDVPLKSDFKPTLKVLSRKPRVKEASGGFPATGMARVSLEDDEDSEEEERKRKHVDFAERQQKAQREREEKQKKYKEARERLFGSSSPVPTTPAAEVASVAGARTSRSKRRNGTRSGPDTQASASSADQSPARSAAPHARLYDPSYSAKTDSNYVQRSEAGQRRSGTASPVEGPTIRAPRGPDDSGRGGFGFAPRRGKSAVT